MIYGIIALSICSIILFCFCLRAHAQAQRTIERNTQVEQENLAIQTENANLYNENQALITEQENLLESCAQSEDELSSLKERIYYQQNVLKSFEATATMLEQNAQNRAKESYEAAAEKFDEELKKRKQEMESSFEKDSQLLLTRIKEEEEKLKDLEDKQFAYIQAKQREEEILAQKDYYRMVLDDPDLDDVKLLRNVQLQLRRKESIDKVIYENYYRPAYDILMSHIFVNNNKSCGIYKITNLENGQAYVGQSVDIKERFRQHIKSSLTSGPATNKLYQQMKKYGPENFSFEILELVDRTKLNERESYWIDFYKTKELGLNGTRGNS